MIEKIIPTTTLRKDLWCTHSRPLNLDYVHIFFFVWSSSYKNNLMEANAYAESDKDFLHTKRRLNCKGIEIIPSTTPRIS